MSSETEKKLIEKIKKGINEKALEAYRLQYFAEHKKEPSALEEDLIKKILEKQLDDSFNDYVGNHLKRLVARAKDMKYKNSGGINKKLGLVVLPLLAGGILWRLNAGDIHTPVLLGIILLAVLLFGLKE